MQQLQEQMQSKREQAQKKLHDERQAQRKYNQEYTDAVEARLEKERVERHEKNIRCINECDALIKTKTMMKRVEKDNEEFRYAVLHNSLYNTETSLKPLMTIPQEGLVDKMAAAVDFPRVQDPSEIQASTKINVESSNILWGYPLNSEVENKKRAAACEKDKIDTFESLHKNKENDSPSPEVTLDAEEADYDENRQTLNFTPGEKKQGEGFTDKDMEDIRDLKKEFEDGELGPLSPS